MAEVRAPTRAPTATQFQADRAALASHSRSLVQHNIELLPQTVLLSARIWPMSSETIG